MEHGQGSNTDAIEGDEGSNVLNGSGGSSKDWLRWLELVAGVKGLERSALDPPSGRGACNRAICGNGC
jgi:hypothetical protein